MSLQDIPQDLIDTTTDILEARRNPELNPKIGPYTQLKKYADDPSIFISFTEIDKIGINPQSDYNTPLGIYTYPLQAAWKNYKVDKVWEYNRKQLDYYDQESSRIIRMERNVISEAFPFATQNPYIQVVQAKKPLTDLQDFSKRDLDDAIEQISRIIKNTNTSENRKKQDAIQLFEDFFVENIEDGTTNALVNTPGGLFWWLTMKCSDRNSVGKLLGRKYKSNSPMRVWNYLLRDLGYDGFIDKGESIIHKGEPTQAVFLHRKALKKIDMIYNIPSIKSKKKEKKGSWMNDNEISDDAKYRYIVERDVYRWKSGTFIGGTWKGGLWEDGLWLDGVWEQGEWRDGIWKDGRFIKGKFTGGTWEDGTFGFKDAAPESLGSSLAQSMTKPSLASFTGNTIWEDGTWLGGEFTAKEWQNGVWHGGLFRIGEWHNGHWKGGIFQSSLKKYGYGATWKDGTWDKGKFIDSTWEDGIWKDGIFHNSEWKNGKWEDGQFIDSQWADGVWEGGLFNGTWFNGKWKGGAFGRPESMISELNLEPSIWYQGVWEDGQFLSGYFKDGLWKSGKWHSGFWDGGRWVRGEIKTTKFSSWGDKDDVFILSRVNPREFEQIEDEVDTIEELRERVAP